MKRSLGATTLIYPMPVFLVGTYDINDKPNIMVAAWGGICCSEPPCLAVSVRKNRWTYDGLMKHKAFTISIPSCDIAKEADFAGIASGRNHDKFAITGLEPVDSTLVKAPYVEQCPVVLELELRTTLELGSHVQFIGTILDVKANEDCFTPEGTLDHSKVNPLLFDGAQREYYAAGPVVGKAFGVGKAFLHK